MPAMALSRVGARVVESGSGGGQELAARAWQKLEALPDPRSPRGRVYPLACLVAIALCAFTAAGNDRLTAAGQWITPASKTWPGCTLRGTPMAGRYRAPDENTIRILLDRPACAATVTRCAARQAQALARGRLRAVAVDGKIFRRARRPDGTRVHLLAPPSTTGPYWTTSRPMTGTTRPAISPNCWDRWTWTAPW